eukprot:GFKZ01011991.1.p2 GENE.GFKZ01011991.1~~GFKZ01011991.1.p2  ORF type:complete len:477 (+),score=63.97 GFKZ01011991.1:197-1432(+)
MPVSTSWCLDPTAKTIAPTASYMRKFLRFLSERKDDDPAICFIFHPCHNHPDLYIQQSRLEWARGPLAAMVNETFAEGLTKEVRLCQSDDPESFQLLAKYLNVLEIEFGGMSSGSGVATLLALARSAHRWDLSQLLSGVCMYLEKERLLRGTEELVDASDVVTLPGVDEGFIEYYWEEVGRQFGEFRMRNGTRVYAKDARGGLTTAEDEEGTDVGLEIRVCPRFPTLWSLAMEMKMEKKVVKTAVERASGEVKEDLLRVVLSVLEPRMANEADVREMLRSFEWREWNYRVRVMRLGVLDAECSVRAMRLLGDAVFEEMQGIEERAAKRRRTDVRDCGYGYGRRVGRERFGDSSSRRAAEGDRYGHAEHPLPSRSDPYASNRNDYDPYSSADYDPYPVSYPYVESPGYALSP